MSNHRTDVERGNSPRDDDEDEALLDPSEAAEIVPDDPDHPMDSDDGEGETDGGHPEVLLQNDSIAHFDSHSDSIFTVANHPLTPTIVATGGGDDTTYIFSAETPLPVLPTSYESHLSLARTSLELIAKITGHTDSINALTFTLPNGDYLLTGGLDGRLRAHSTTTPSSSTPYPLLAETQEVPEINFLHPCPHPSFPNTIALGASDGSVWVYTIDASDRQTPLQVLQAYYLHTASCTAGAWTPDGKLLTTVSEDGSFYVWDPFGEASAAGVAASSTGQAIIGLTTEDQRFAIGDGLFSIAVAPSGAFAAVGGAHGMIRIVGLPRLTAATRTSGAQSQKGGGAKNKPGGGKKSGGPATGGAAAAASAGQAGQILASLQAQSESVETLAFSPHHSLLAAGSVDGSIVLFDTAHRFAIRRHIKEAHEEEYAVVQIAFGSLGAEDAWFLTSCGMDGVVRKWDCRGGTAASGQGLVKEWRGHRGEGEAGGVLGFVMAEGRVITAGDDGISLVFV